MSTIFWWDQIASMIPQLIKHGLGHMGGKLKKNWKSIAFLKLHFGYSKICFNKFMIHVTIVRRSIQQNILSKFIFSSTSTWETRQGRNVINIQIFFLPSVIWPITKYLCFNLLIDTMAHWYFKPGVVYLSKLLQKTAYWWRDCFCPTTHLTTSECTFKIDVYITYLNTSRGINKY